jgi:hypothetical protein
MPEIRIVVDVGEKATTFTTSSSGVKAVLTKHGTWCGSVSLAMVTHTTSRTGFTLGSSTWFSMGEQLQSWLSDGRDPTFVVEGAT